MNPTNVRIAAGRRRYYGPRCQHDLPVGCCAVCAEMATQKELEELARITGLSFAELDADMTAPDPRRTDVELDT